ncbi:MAG: phosphate ABC transporter ATP-binding protein [Desulfurococcaceae archaeon]|nr:phosphate ABC transporter ATP-binding protein [Desulfurococcaceae archaeon]MCC6060908.1 phosphate ABC transporter ATP-binding protein [Desulfurococcaceae archaeon]
MSPAIEVKGLRVRISGKDILKGVDLRVPEATITAIMGPSGSGKTTFLKVLNRLIELVDDVEVSGEVRVYGSNIFDMDVYKVRRLFGMVFQTPNPFPHLSIYDNVAIGAKVNNVARSRKELDEIVRWALEKAMLWDEVKNRLHDPPWRLSGGQQQRLCLARALAMKPRILLLDEPTANIDPVNTAQLEDALRALRRDENITVAIVTHMPHQAIRVSDYIVMFYDGRVVEEGPTGEIAISPREDITRRFLRGEM